MEKVDYIALGEVANQFRADKNKLNDFIEQYDTIIREVGLDGNVWGGNAATNAKEALERIKTMLTELRDQYVTQLSSYADTYIQVMQGGDASAYGQKQ